MSAIVDRSHIEAVWDRLAGRAFRPARLRTVRVGPARFQVLHLPRQEEFVPGAYVETGLSFLAWPRLAGYRHRFVLVPTDCLTGPGRWEIRPGEVADWMRWAGHMNHVVTFSTFKSGASNPFVLHAQSFPVAVGGTRLTALWGAPARPLVAFGRMPHFQQVQIEVLQGYPVRGLRIRSRGTDAGRGQAAEKAYELAVNYDGLKAFNIVVVPETGAAPLVYFFPRRKDGRATFGRRRWQIAALEVNGLLQAKDSAQAARLDARTVGEIFATTTLNDAEFAEFLTLIGTF